MEITRKDFILGFVSGVIIAVLVPFVYARISEIASRSSLDMLSTASTEKSGGTNDGKNIPTPVTLTINVMRGSILREPFTDPVHIDLYLNSATVFSRDAQDGSAVTFENIPFGVYKSRVKAIGYKESINTFTYKTSGDTVKVVLEN